MPLGQIPGDQLPIVADKDLPRFRGVLLFRSDPTLVAVCDEDGATLHRASLPIRGTDIPFSQEIPDPSGSSEPERSTGTNG